MSRKITEFQAIASAPTRVPLLAITEPHATAPSLTSTVPSDAGINANSMPLGRLDDEDEFLPLIVGKALDAHKHGSFAPAGLGAHAPPLLLLAADYVRLLPP